MELSILESEIKKALRFRDVEEDIDSAVSVGLDHNPAFEEGEGMKGWNKALETVFPFLLEAYIEKGKVDTLIAWFVDQFDAGGGDKFFVPISTRLEEIGASDSLSRMWRGVAAQRMAVNKRDKAISAINNLIEALNRLGSDTNEMQARLRAMERNDEKLADPIKSDMSEDLFWELVERAKQESTTAFERGIMLRLELQLFSGKAISNFADILASKLNDLYSHELWAVVYIARGGCSDDAFEFFRAWIISEGRETFEKAKFDPESIVDLISQAETIQLDQLLYAADEAYGRRTGKSMKRNVLSPNEPSGIPWKEEDLPARFPHVCNRSSISTLQTR